ncbi:Na(+)-translocating NADH-quinone reductase subunit C [Galbibacter marinus]|uniref:Na(+)-translocating NADH-quinone reductase subunit C n=1 Tax=Galbibacter marinus TaxID=555500 RepID=K2Q3I8_9FLAO|nr:NADH:ubiquinone reductase (Na(+)-transporting) subunit C [Galbibacter marinus]EKF55421.1 Na(+)-translocating NADH-quinone reductase subunit C [Galbibacter marinus]
MNRESNAYTLIFAVIMVVVVASALAIAATSLQPLQAQNIKIEKMQDILSTIEISTTKEEAEEIYNQYITEVLALDSNGEVVLEGPEAFAIDLAKEYKKETNQQRFPLYVADVDGSTYYVIPLYGAGLWNSIWGYISLEEDGNTVKGTVFSHAGETPGLGAEITQDWFQERFIGEKIKNSNGEFVGINVQKGYSGGNDKDDNAVDAISGATITGDGVTNMIHERLEYYISYLEKQNTNLALN